MFLLWSIWKGGNERTWKEKSSTALEVVVHSSSQLNAFRFHNEVSSVSRTGRILMRWKCPLVGYEKVNIDGSFHHDTKTAVAPPGGLPDLGVSDVAIPVVEILCESFNPTELPRQVITQRDYDNLNKHAIQIFFVLTESGLADKTKELFKPRPELGILTDVAVFTIVIWAYTYANKTGAALKVYHQMIAAGVAPTSCTYTILIISLATHSSSDVSFVGYAKKYFLEMLDKEMKPYGACYMCVFDTIACGESVEKAREFLQQIQAMKGMQMYDDLINKTTDKEMQEVFRDWRTN
ncbi:hypothetical protein ACLB2K_053190 [Fragaria x ananassa]